MSKNDFSIFDTMSTRVLQEILYQDSILPEGEGFDQDAVLYVMQVLARREEGGPPTEDAWRRFNEYYRSNDGAVIVPSGWWCTHRSAVKFLNR